LNPPSPDRDGLPSLGINPIPPARERKPPAAAPTRFRDLHIAARIVVVLLCVLAVVFVAGTIGMCLGLLGKGLGAAW
jgi:hypothetical protein